MLLNACIVVTVIYNVIAYHEKVYSANVGTVLFTAKDRERERWSKSQICLLQARKYFQTILPPPGLINNFNEDYIHTLLKYFKNAYTHIKREAIDTETDTLLTTALSDAVGGYLKVWILPVAKLNFYGGTICKEHVTKLLLFYNEIKNYIGTDGEGWRCPDDYLINAMTINIAPRIVSLDAMTRSIKDPCDHLAYFEKTPNGLGIPLPNINWDKKSSTMFIPLKNVSLIPLNSPDKNDILLKYYDIAKNCIATSNPTESVIFEEKFQQWLANDVIPHLKDDNLYLPLFGVLSLANQTRNLYENLFQQYGSKYHIQPNTYLPNEITSKKVIIIFIILLLEVAWCVPTLIYLLCTRRKKNKNSSSNVYLFMDHSKPGKTDKFSLHKKEKHENVEIYPRASVKDIKDIETQRPSTPLCLADINTSCTGKLHFRQPQVTYNEFETQYPSSHYAVTAGTGSRSYISSKNQSVEAIITDVRAIPKKSALKKPPESQSQMRTIHMARVVPMASQENFQRSEQTDKVFPIIEEDGKSSPKRNAFHGKSVTTKAQNKTELNKATKSLSPTKQFEHNKDMKNIPRKRSDQNKEQKYISSKKSEKYGNIRTCQPQVLKTDIQKKEKSNTGPMKTSASLNTKTSSQISKAMELEVANGQEPSSHNYNTETPLSCTCTSCLHCTTSIRYDMASEIGGKTKLIETCHKDGPSTVKGNRFQIFNEQKSNKAAFKVSNSGNPLFEITLDRPATVSVDVSSTHKKQSKIPKLRSNMQELAKKLSGRVQSSREVNDHKSLLPQPKKTVDDIVLAREGSCTSDRYCLSKLNDTI